MSECRAGLAAPATNACLIPPGRRTHLAPRGAQAAYVPKLQMLPSGSRTEKSREP